MTLTTPLLAIFSPTSFWVITGIVSIFVFAHLYLKREVYQGEWNLLKKSQVEASIQRGINTRLVCKIIDRPSVSISDEERRQLKKSYRKWQNKEWDLFARYAKGKKKLTLLEQIYAGVGVYSEPAFEEVDAHDLEGRYEIFMKDVFSDISSSQYEDNYKSDIRKKVTALGVLLNITQPASQNFVVVRRFVFSLDEYPYHTIIVFDMYQKMGVR